MEIILMVVFPILGFLLGGLSFLFFYIFTKRRLCILEQLKQIYENYKSNGFYEFAFKKNIKKDLLITFLCLLPFFVVLIYFRAYLNTYIAIFCMLTIVLIIYVAHIWKNVGISNAMIKDNTLTINYGNTPIVYTFDSIEKIGFNMRYYSRRRPTFLSIKCYNSDKYDSHRLLYSNTSRAVAEIVFLEIARKNSLASIDFMSEDTAQQILTDIKCDYDASRTYNYY